MEIPDSVQTAWFKHLHVIRAQRIAGGLSSSRVWRLNAPKGDYCLKAWSRSTTEPERLKHIHHHLQLLQDAKIEFSPRLMPNVWGSCLLEDQNFVWEVTTWLPGEADKSRCVSQVRRQNAVLAVAKVHDTWRRFEVRRAISPGWDERLSLLRKAHSQFSNFNALSNYLNNDWLKRQSNSGTGEVNQADPELLQELSGRTISYLVRDTQRLMASMRDLNQPQELHFVVRDLHAEHVLYTEDNVSGLIDFGAARVDEPLLDLVRLLGSQAPFDRQARYEALEFYINLRAAWCQDFSAIALPGLFARYKILDEVSTLLSSVQWFNWIVVQRRSFPVPLPQILIRWVRLLDRLKNAEW